MTIKPMMPCRQAGCAALVSGSGYCSKHTREDQQSHDERRGSATERGYGYRWQKARLGYLKSHPLCVSCQSRGVTMPACVVDHIVPHCGDKNLFWQYENWQALCKPCHDAKTAREDGRWGGQKSGGFVA